MTSVLPTPLVSPKVMSCFITTCKCIRIGIHVVTHVCLSIYPINIPQNLQLYCTSVMLKHGAGNYTEIVDLFFQVHVHVHTCTMKVICVCVICKQTLNVHAPLHPPSPIPAPMVPASMSSLWF